MIQLQHLFILVAVSFFGSSSNLNTQHGTENELYKTLKTKDSLLFECAFNKCETQYLEQLIAEDFEFYHDIGGIQESKKAFIEIMQNGICNPNNSTKSRRELVEGSLEVFPLKHNGELYGALQNGVHKFFETTNGIESPGSVAKFSHLWILNNNSWMLKRVISYDHKMQVVNPSDNVSVSEEQLDSYIGQYKAKNSGIVVISRTEKGLHINAGGLNADIYAKTQTLFANAHGSLTFEFITDNNLHVSKFIVRENNTIVEEAIKQ